MFVGVYWNQPVCPPLRGGHREVIVSVHLVSIMELNSVYLVGIGLGISGVRKSTCGVALNKEKFDPTSSSPKNVYMSVRLCTKILVSVKAWRGY